MDNINETTESWIRKICISKDKNRKKEKKEEKIKSDRMKHLLQLSMTFPTKMEEEASVWGFLCPIIRMQPLLPSDEDAESLDKPSLAANVKANIVRYEDAKATSKYETLAEVISYFQRMYLSNPNFLHLVFKPVYDLMVPFTNKEAIENINQIQNILTSVKTEGLIEQITGQEFQEMTIKCILNRRIDLYSDALTKYAKAQEEEEPENDDETSVRAALKNLSVSGTALKKASLTVNQIHFFIGYLKNEIGQLNFLESRGNTDTRQTGTRGRYQGNNQGERQFRPQYQNFNMIEQRGINQQQQNTG